MNKKKLLGPIITAAAAIVALIIITAAVSASSSAKKGSDEKTNTTEVASSETASSETETTTEEEVAGENPKNKKEAERIEKEADKRVYLTFDDGPGKYTNELLDILKEYDVKATFFDVKVSDEEDKAALKRCYDEGHTIAIHTMTHDYDEVYANIENWKEDVLGEQKFIEDVTGIKTFYYRFPGGSSNTIARNRGTSIEECIKWLNANGFTYYDWNVDNEDATGKSFTPEQLVANVVDYMPEGGDYMVLMHDTAAKENTIKSIPLLIETLKKEGYTLCQITDNTEYFQHKKYDQVGD